MTSSQDEVFKLYDVNDVTKYYPKFTEGEWRVGVTFNPSNNEWVDEVKRATAELIDLLEEMKSKSNDPRSLAKAQTDYEQAAMWAVKGITKTKKE